MPPNTALEPTGTAHVSSTIYEIWKSSLHFGVSLRCRWLSFGSLGGIMQFTLIMALVVLAVALIALEVCALYLVVRDTRRRSGKWGCNFRRVFCPRCHSRQPVVRVPTSRRQFWWGGWTCKACGCEIDKWGVEVASSSSLHESNAA
jgi:hypothetical protein